MTKFHYAGWFTTPGWGLLSPAAAQIKIVDLLVAHLTHRRAGLGRSRPGRDKISECEICSLKKVMNTGSVPQFNMRYHLVVKTDKFTDSFHLHLLKHMSGVGFILLRLSKCIRLPEVLVRPKYSCCIRYIASRERGEESRRPHRYEKP